MQISGLIPATITPFRADGSIDFQDLATHVERVANQEGVFGVCVNGNAGEILAMTLEERAQVVATARKVVPGHVKLIVGIAGIRPDDLVADGLNARAAGADALLVLPPFDARAYRALLKYPDVVHAVFERLDREVGLPMIIFLYPDTSGASYPTDVLVRLADLPNVVAVKAGAGQVTRYAEVYDALKDKIAVLAACDAPPLLGMLLYGAAGALIGISSVGTPIWAELVREATTGSAQRAKELFNQSCIPLMKAIYENQQPTTPTTSAAALKVALEQLGHIRSAFVRPPAPNATDGRRVEIRAGLVQAGLL